MPICKAIVTGNRTNEFYRETTRSNCKQLSIATMPDRVWSTISFPTPLIFRYHLPLIMLFPTCSCIPAVDVPWCSSYLLSLSCLLLMCSYRCCFVPGVPARDTRVSAVAAYPTAVEVSSTTNVSNVPGGPCCCWHSYCCWLPCCFVLPAFFASLLLLMYLQLLLILLLLTPCSCFSL